MERLEKDMTDIGEMGNHRVCDLQNKLDEVNILRRQDQVELQKTQIELKRVNHLLLEHKTIIRHEKNNTKIMEMENDAMLKQTHLERDNLYKMQ